MISGKPSPADVSQEKIDDLRSQLLDTSLPLFQRYRAMFALRNIGTPAAVDALAAGFSDDSALFKYVTVYLLCPFRLLTAYRRHEIAFVFGQLLSTHSVPALLKVLENNQESDMVRHEAAEALGGIATPEVLPHLKEWMQREDAPRVVRESCQVALDMYEVRRTRQICTQQCFTHFRFSTKTPASSSTQMVSNQLPLLRKLMLDPQNQNQDKADKTFALALLRIMVCSRHCSLPHLYCSAVFILSLSSSIYVYWVQTCCFLCANSSSSIFSVLLPSPLRL